MGASIGVFVGSSLYKWRHYCTHPGLYAMSPAPWYLSIQIGAVITAGLLLVEGLALYLVSRQVKKRENETKGEDCP